jgi:fibro-slime domain-containing protein
MSRRRIWLAIVATLVAFPAASHAQVSLNYQYYKVRNSADNPDFKRGIDGGIVAGIVQSMLGADGLPVYSGLNGFPSLPVTQVNGSNEIQWWTPGADILADGTGTITGPLAFNNGFFPTGESSNANWFRTAIFTGAVNMASPGTLSFTLGSDDDAWLFIDGMLVGDDGGIKGLAFTPFTTTTLSAGTHNLALFFADRHEVESALVFDPQFAVTATPEPASLLLFATGFIGMAGVAFRRRNTR